MGAQMVPTADVKFYHLQPSRWGGGASQNAPPSLVQSLAVNSGAMVP